MARWKSVRKMRVKAHRLGPIGFVRAHSAPVFVSGAIQSGILRPKTSGVDQDSVGTTMHHLDLEAILEGEIDEPMVEGVDFGAVRYIEIDDDELNEGHWITIGRTAQSDVVVNDYTVSKYHARIAYHKSEGHWLLEEMGSTNGTKLGEQRLTPKEAQPLKSGMCVVFGRVELTFLDAKGFFEFLIR